MTIIDEGKRVRVSKDRLAELETYCSNWMHLSVFMSDLQEDELLKLLYLEAKGKGRIRMMDRIFSRHNNIRRQCERAEVYAAMGLSTEADAA